MLKLMLISNILNLRWNVRKVVVSQTQRFAKTKARNKGEVEGQDEGKKKKKKKKKE
jgi:hypothetical protein